MTVLNDLDVISITEMETDKAIDLLRQVRLSRRIPSKKTIIRAKKKQKQKIKINANQASELLKILTGGS